MQRAQTTRPTRRAQLGVGNGIRSPARDSHSGSGASLQGRCAAPGRSAAETDPLKGRRGGRTARPGRAQRARRSPLPYPAAAPRGLAAAARPGGDPGGGGAAFWKQRLGRCSKFAGDQ